MSLLSSTLKPLLLGAAFLLPVFSHAGDQYPPEAYSSRSRVTVTVEWVASFREATERCNEGSPPEEKKNVYACYLTMSNTIIAVQPRSFNDLFLLAVLGHEFWHALGAEHP